MMSLLSVDKGKCGRDGICIEVCPIGILKRDGEGFPTVRPGLAQHCIRCGHCVAVCPHAALDNRWNRLESQGELPKFPVLEPQTAMQFLRSRRSIRCYEDKAVSRDLVRELLEVCRYAPSGHNSQGVSYLVVDQREFLREICSRVVDWMRMLVLEAEPLARKLHMPGIIRAFERGQDRILRNAPGLIAAHAPTELRTAQVTTYLALEYAELFATTLGIGTCWAGYTQACAQQYPPLRELLGIADERTVTGMILYGYPKYLYHRLPERNPLQVTWLEGRF